MAGMLIDPSNLALIPGLTQEEGSELLHIERVVMPLATTTGSNTWTYAEEAVLPQISGYAPVGILNCYLEVTERSHVEFPSAYAGTYMVPHAELDGQGNVSLTITASNAAIVEVGTGTLEVVPKLDILYTKTA